MTVEVEKEDTTSSKGNHVLFPPSDKHDHDDQIASGEPRRSPELKRKLKSRHLHMIAIGE
ncbi:hypothetical protein VI817_006883 [Penicillium citrinum]|nr:hypothetical protein VI817_006883 [Penicillium citrinum]